MNFEFVCFILIAVISYGSYLVHTLGVEFV